MRAIITIKGIDFLTSNIPDGTQLDKVVLLGDALVRWAGPGDDLNTWCTPAPSHYFCVLLELDNGFQLVSRSLNQEEANSLEHGLRGNFSMTLFEAAKKPLLN